MHTTCRRTILQDILAPFIPGMLLSLAACTPLNNHSDTLPLEARVAGCCLVDTVTSAKFIVQTTSQTANPNPQSTNIPGLDFALGAALNEMAILFNVQPKFLFIDGASSDNAYAMPYPMLPNTTGTVALGRTLLRSMLSKARYGDFAILTTCAHEFGHIVQYTTEAYVSLNTGQPTKQRCELHADFLAGYHIGRRKFDYGADQLRDVVEAFASLGDTNFNDPQHHGTAEERLAALDAGFRMGRASNKGIGEANKAGLFYVGAL